MLRVCVCVCGARGTIEPLPTLCNVSDSTSLFSFFFLFLLLDDVFSLDSYSYDDYEPASASHHA